MIYMEPLTINAFSTLSMNPLTITAGPSLSIIAVILATIILSVLFAGILSLGHSIITGPAFEKKDTSTFDLYMFFGEQVRAVAAKPIVPGSILLWEEPEAYFHVHTERRIPVSLGYRVDHLV